MHLLASCSLEKSREFNGRLVLPNEDKKSPDKVTLNIVVKDGSTGVFEEVKGTEYITFVGNPTSYCPTNMVGRVFNEYSLEDLLNGKVSDVKDVVTLVRLPKDYSNMLELKKYSDEYSYVRFIGGNLLGVEGVSIGRSDRGKDSRVVFNEIYDTYVEVDLEDLDGLQEIVKRTRKRVEGDSKVKRKKGKSSSEKKPKQPKKQVVAFSNLFGGDEEAF